ncbi:MAG: MBL fold metallo-hydrolase [Candidatus Hodarchaeales archaeon]|jgi:glyoxylase-like metal-dependent hydrolase (beta-lactamase superfamily II)
MKEVIPGITWLLGQGFDSNVYIIESNQEILMIDSGAGKLINQRFQTSSQSTELLKKVIESKGILNFCFTHSHIDHVGGLLSLQFHHKWDISASEFEAKQLASGNSSYLDPILNSVCQSLDVTTLLNEGDIINVGDFSFEIMETPGHTKGSIVLYERVKKILISGDTLFPQGSFGRTDLPSGSSKELLDSLKRLSDLEIRILLPGHMPPVMSATPIDSARNSFRNARSMLFDY